jgi:flavin-dependent dehydrogenase
VPKESGWLNVGIGGFAERIKSAGQDIKTHWAHFATKLGDGLTRGAHYDPAGYSYFLRGRVDVVRRDDAFITGDAAGLASRDLGEGIGPAIRSGLRAADAILSGVPYHLDDVTGMSVASIARSMLTRAARPFGSHGRRRAGEGGAHGLRHDNQ